MPSHPAKFSSTVAINALWCVLIALALLAFPFIARQVRLQTGIAPRHGQSTQAAGATTQPPPASPVLVTQTDTPPTPN